MEKPEYIYDYTKQQIMDRHWVGYLKWAKVNPIDGSPRLILETDFWQWYIETKLEQN